MDTSTMDVTESGISQSIGCFSDASVVSALTSLKQPTESSAQSSQSSASSSMEGTQQASSSESQTVQQSRTRNCEKYNLRRSSLRVRAETEQKKHQPKEKKPKIRPPPLSKYRRRSANARERCRMQEINEAFEMLKKALPQAGLVECSGSGSEGSSSSSSSKSKGQPTKITVLRLAINYIHALSDILGYQNDRDDLGSDAASTSTPSMTSGSGDEDSLVSDVDTGVSDLDTGVSDLDRRVSDLDTRVSDLDIFASDLGPDFPPDFEADLNVTFSPEEEMCLKLVAGAL